MSYPQSSKKNPLLTVLVGNNVSWLYKMPEKFFARKYIGFHNFSGVPLLEKQYLKGTFLSEKEQFLLDSEGIDLGHS